MGARIRIALTSLGARLLVPLLLTVAVVLSVHAFTSLRSIREEYLTFLGEEVRRSSGLIRRATHDGMLLNRLDEVQSTIERIAEGNEVAAIRVYDRRGTIVLSSDASELGVSLPMESGPCSACHGDGTPEEPARRGSSDLTYAGDAQVLRELSVIDNEPACSATGCHQDAAPDAVLGVLDVTLSMRPVEAAMASARRRLLGTTFILMLTLGAVAAVVFRRFIHRPIRSLQEGTRRIAAGDLDTAIEVEGGHELARLASDFNRMAADLKRARQEVTEWSLTLEDKVRQRTGELRQAQRQVLHMEKMVSLGKLSATVAHEINNPLSGMLTYARLAQRELQDVDMDEEVREQVRRYLHVIQMECSRCGNIVQNLLVFARRTGSEMTDVDLNEILTHALMLVRHHMEISGIELDADLIDGDPRVTADPGQLEQAFVALLMNGVEAMPDGGTLTVTAWGDAEDVFIDLSDTGVGIPEDVLPQIFEPFFSTKHSEAGVGLGLAVTYGIVHRHGGTITAESTVGEGATFHVSVKRNPPGEAEAPTLEELVAPATP